MSKRKVPFLLLIASGYMMALGCSVIPLRIPLSLSGILQMFTGGGN
jgi:hypothetical protein